MNSHITIDKDPFAEVCMEPEPILPPEEFSSTEEPQSQRNSKQVSFGAPTTRWFFYTSDDMPPRQDMSNVLKGRAAQEHARSLILGSGWKETVDLVYREFPLPASQGGCGGDWNQLEQRLQQISEPTWYRIGILWDTLHPGMSRPEEADLLEPPLELELPEEEWDTDFSDLEYDSDGDSSSSDSDSDSDSNSDVHPNDGWDCCQSPSNDRATHTTNMPLSPETCGLEVTLRE